MHLPPPPSSRILDSAAEVTGEARMVRSYEAWKGSNVFFLQGRVIFGPDVRSVPLTVFLIAAPVVVFCVFVARKLMDDFPHNWGISIMVIAVVFTVYVLILLLLTSGRDPGIIPRNLYPPEQEGSFGASETPQLRMPPRTKDVVVNGINVKIKYCDTCMLYRPPRCSHCSICNNCVERFDHHCPWVGQCIGKRNYRFFFMFVSSTTLLCLYVFGFCWVYIKRIMDGEEISIWRAMIKTPASIALIIYTFICVWFVGGLSVFHLYLISTNQSTYENFRYRYERHANPYDIGVMENFKEIFCTSIPPSKNNFRAKVPKEPVITSRRIGDGSVSPNNIKMAGDKKMGRRPIQGSTEDYSDHEGYLSNDDSHDKDMAPDLSSTLPLNVSAESGSIHGRHSSCGRRSGSWNIVPEVSDLAIEVEVSKQINGNSANFTTGTQQSHAQTTNM